MIRIRFLAAALAATAAESGSASVHLGEVPGRGRGVIVECAPESGMPAVLAAVIGAVFAGATSACDLNGDGTLSAADLTGALRQPPPPSETPTAPTPTMTEMPSPTPSTTPVSDPTDTATPSATATEVHTPIPTLAFGFADATDAAGLNHMPADVLSGGVAAGDYDGDGDVDLYMVRVDGGGNPLYRNRGDGTFEDVGEAAGVALSGFFGSSPVFADFDGDGWLDLFVRGVVGSGTRLLRNRGDGSFEDISAQARIAEAYENNIPYCDGCDSPGSPSWGDFDRDGDLDLFITHLETAIPPVGTQNLWRNDGNGAFTDVTVEAGVVGIIMDRGKGLSSYMYSPNFVDIDNDGWLDLLVASDYGTTRVYTNDRDGTFTDRTNTAVITDENGMGAAIGDYDRDGNLDWFVTSIWDPILHLEGIFTGNRLYRGLGDGTFEDVTAQAGVGAGWWGWAACFADFDNDGNLDIFHVNGADAEFFTDDPSRLFMSNGDGTFSERSQALGIDDRRFGFGAVCFDYDHDGDIDIFIQNRRQPPRLYRNDGGNQHNWLAIRLRGRAPNSEAIGARISVTVGDRTQIHEMRAGTNFMSQDPAIAHFGLGPVTMADAVHIRWPDQTVTALGPVAANQRLVVTQP